MVNIVYSSYKRRNRPWESKRLKFIIRNNLNKIYMIRIHVGKLYLNVLAVKNYMATIRKLYMIHIHAGMLYQFNRSLSYA